LQTMTEIASEKSTTIIFPLPIEMLRAFGAMVNPPAAAQPPAIKPPAEEKTNKAA
jgi:hypothetical protein